MRLITKKAILIPLVLFMILYTACPPEPVAVYGESLQNLNDVEYELKDYRINKTHIEGKFVCADNPDYYYKIGDGFAVMSDALYQSQGLKGDFVRRWAMFQSFKALTWLSFTTSYSEDWGGNFTDWKQFIVYTSDVGELETFYVEDTNILPWERQAYNKILGDSDKVSLAERMIFDAASFSSEQQTNMTAIQVFPKMGDRLYKLEIEKVICGKVTGYRDENGIPNAGFEFKGYRFEYKLSGDSYDILPDTILKIHTASSN